jgi:hypothetical protein
VATTGMVRGVDRPLDRVPPREAVEHDARPRPRRARRLPAPTEAGARRREAPVPRDRPQPRRRSRGGARRRWGGRSAVSRSGGSGTVPPRSGTVSRSTRGRRSGRRGSRPSTRSRTRSTRFRRASCGATS